MPHRAMHPQCRATHTGADGQRVVPVPKEPTEGDTIAKLSEGQSRVVVQVVGTKPGARGAGELAAEESTWA